MFSRDTWIEIVNNLKNNKLRTFLSGFSIGWGIFMLVMLLGMGNGLKNGFMSEFLDDEALNYMEIYTSRTTKPYKGNKSERRIELKLEDLVEVKKEYGDRTEGISGAFRHYGLLEGSTESGRYTIRGGEPYIFPLNKIKLHKGRLLTQSDMDGFSKSIVIGKLVQEDLFPKKNNVLGDQIFLDGINYTIVGVFSKDGDDDAERECYIPLYTAINKLSRSKELSHIEMGHDLSYNEEEALAFANSMEEELKEKYNVHPDDNRGISVSSYAEGIGEVQGFLGYINWVVIFVGIGTLIAGTIGISNVMIVSVKERTKEIGIRKAIGAQPRAIVNSVVLESLFVTITTGLIGLGIGLGVLYIVGPLLEEGFMKEPETDLFTLFFSLFILVLAGLLAGYLPARRASRIKPIVALRAD